MSGCRRYYNAVAAVEKGEKCKNVRPVKLSLRVRHFEYLQSEIKLFLHQSVSAPRKIRRGRRRHLRDAHTCVMRIVARQEAKVATRTGILS